MRRFWWTVWIKVAVVALLLIMGYRYASNKIEEIVSPYLIEETQTVEEDGSNNKTGGNLVMDMLGKIEESFGVKIDFENLIFDFANDFAMDMKEQSEQERNPISEPLS